MYFIIVYYKRFKAKYNKKNNFNKFAPILTIE